MKRASIATAAFFCVLASSMAQAPGMINYQGRLVSNGVPAEGVVNMQFKLYPASSGGAAVYSFTTNSVPVANGLYSVMIGNTNSANLLNVLTNSSLYLEVWAYGTNLSPRTQLASVPYALKAEGLIGSGATNWIDIATFNATNALKVDAVTFNATNALKVDIATFNATNALKVDTSTFNATNELKTDVSVFNATNALKVDIATFNATNALKLDKSGGVLTGELIVSNNVTITSNLYVTGFITNAAYYGNGVGITNLNAGNLAAGTVAAAIDGSAITNLAGGNITSGDIASDRMTANAVVVSDFTAADVVLVGSGPGTFTQVVGFTGIITNVSTLSTNTLYFYRGILTNAIVNP